MVRAGAGRAGRRLATPALVPAGHRQLRPRSAQPADLRGASLAAARIRGRGDGACAGHARRHAGRRVRGLGRNAADAMDGSDAVRSAAVPRVVAGRALRAVAPDDRRRAGGNELDGGGAAGSGGDSLRPRARVHLRGPGHGSLAVPRRDPVSVAGGSGSRHGRGCLARGRYDAARSYPVLSRSRSAGADTVVGQPDCGRAQQLARRLVDRDPAGPGHRRHRHRAEPAGGRGPRALRSVVPRPTRSSTPDGCRVRPPGG